MLLGDIECTITLQTETELKFVVPSSENYVDGDNTVVLKISYFDGREVHTLTDSFFHFFLKRELYGNFCCFWLAYR